MTGKSQDRCTGAIRQTSLREVTLRRRDTTSPGAPAHPSSYVGASPTRLLPSAPSCGLPGRAPRTSDEAPILSPCGRCCRCRACPPGLNSRLHGIPHDSKVFARGFPSTCPDHASRPTRVDGPRAVTVRRGAHTARPWSSDPRSCPSVPGHEPLPTGSAPRFASLPPNAGTVQFASVAERHFSHTPGLPRKRS